MPEFSCEHCGRKLNAADAQVGLRLRCPKCKGIVRVPEPAMAGASAGPAGTGSSAGSGGGGTTRTYARPPSVFSSHGPAGRRYGFNCPYCSSRLEGHGGIAGHEAQCPTCGKTIVVPVQDRYGRLIDPLTGKVVRQDPHPVHAYAAAGERAPKILRDDKGKQVIGCPKCSRLNPITANNCNTCGMPFTMEGTTLEAGGGANGLATASLVLGIISIPMFCVGVIPLLAVVLGLFGLRSGGESGRGLAITGIVLGGIGLTLGALFWIGRL